ncbi:MAG: asparagine synthase (glutamine-hydrolyzing) [Legionellaceae bacterium]|nr:asparagine synthase (glutamine-hydrolyzing) [Legionellaceae bacterium]
MCGITGVVSLKKPSVNVAFAKPMADKIAHRGPDDAGYLFFHTGTRHSRAVSFYQNLTDDKFKQVDDLLPSIDSSSAKRELLAHDWDIYLGHRRLSILDITHAGHQPMSDLSKNVWLAYNGEIYNFKEIKAELQAHGHQFKTSTDTEVVIYAYIQWGIACVEKFNGMFAFALYDNFKKKIYLVRDRYGIKPLYYTLTREKTLIFASEIKAILEYKEYEAAIDTQALLEYFTFQNIFTDKTLHKSIHLLPAGNYLTIDLLQQENNFPVQTQYWDFNFSEPSELVCDEREYIEELDRLFSQAVKRQLVSDVEVGSYLSGGMDSGSITAVAAQHLRSMKTFTVGFDLTSVSGLELSFDERAKAEAMSYHFKTEHYEMVLKSGDMERCMRDFSYHLEEPRVGQSYPNYYAAKLASKFVKVVLSGGGGDELFAGYPWRYYRAVDNKSFDSYIDKYYQFWKRLIDNEQLRVLFSPVAGEVDGVWTKDIFREVFKHNHHSLYTPEDYVNHSLYFEAKTFLHGLLVVEDKLSMAHSLETRLPFLDNDLVDFSQRIPVNLKLSNLTQALRINENEAGDKAAQYFEKTNDGKILLRKAMSKYIPEEINRAVKQGFSSPDKSWFKGDSIEFVKEKLLSDDAAIYRFFDKNLVDKLLGEHLSGTENYRLFIWSLINLEAFLEHYAVSH